MDKGQSAFEGACLHRGAESAVARALQLLQYSRKLAISLALLFFGCGVFVKMAKSPGWKAQEFYLAGIQQRHRPVRNSQAKDAGCQAATSNVCINGRLTRKRVQPRNRMRENRTSGSVRGRWVTGVPTVRGIFEQNY